MCQYSNVPRERWYIVCFTLNYPWAVYPGCRLTMLWMQDNGAGSLHSWWVLAWIKSGGVETFHQLSCGTDPTPITHVKLTWLCANFGCLLHSCYLLWNANSHWSGLGQVWLLSSQSEMTLLDQRWFCKTLQPQILRRLVRENSVLWQYSEQIWCGAMSELRGLLRTVEYTSTKWTVWVGLIL